MDKKLLYDTIAKRKIKPQDFEPYNGNNGRVNKCHKLFLSGELKTGGTIVDVGGGIGDLGHCVNNLFDRRVCIDISTGNLCAAFKKGNECYKSDIDHNGLGGYGVVDDEAIDCFYRLEDNSVDVITALDFIEHIIDPENFARECYRVLKNSGQVFINTPNIEYWEHLQSLVKYGVFPHTSGDKEVYHGGHLAFYGFNDMVSIFGSVGFKNFKQLKDDECYKNPPEYWQNAAWRGPKNQDGYVLTCMRLGNPNLLFKCEKL